MKITLPSPPNNLPLSKIPFSYVVVINGGYYKMTCCAKQPNLISLLDLTYDRIVDLPETTIPSNIFKIKELVLENT